MPISVLSIKNEMLKIKLNSEICKLFCINQLKNNKIKSELLGCKLSKKTIINSYMHIIICNCGNLILLIASHGNSHDRLTSSRKRDRKSLR